MAGVEFHEKWWTDVRRSALIEELKSELIVDGLAAKLFRVAQGYWKNGRGGIPLEIFSLIPHKDSLLRVGLAVQGDPFVFVRGSLEHLDWLRTHTENASLAGKKSAEARRKKHGTAQPKPKKPRKTSEQDANQVEPKLTGDQPTSNPSSSSSSFPSSSSQDSFLSEKSEAEPATEDELLNQRTSKVIAKYCELWKSRYGTNPFFSGKWTGNAKTLVKDHGLKRALELVEKFMEMNDTNFLRDRHSFELILLKLSTIAHYAGTGVTITQTQLRTADQSMTNQTVMKGVGDHFRNGGTKP